MSKAWKQLDLGGGGVQSANLRLTRLLRRRSAAYGLLLLFPLGLHRDYLHDRRGGWLYRAGTLLCAGAWLAGYPMLGWAGAAVLAACAAREAAGMDDAVAQANKRLRMRFYLGPGQGTPPDFRGHYSDADAGGTAQGPGGDDSRPASFAEQEKRLRELHAIRRKKSR